MNPARPKSIPLPCALLALSVAVCLGAAGPVEASTLRSVGTNQADQRETLEHIIGAIQQAAKKLTDRLTGQALLLDPHGGLTAAGLQPVPTHPASDTELTVLFLREALLNLPPPSC